MILENLTFLYTIILKLHYWCSPKKLSMFPKILVRTGNISRAEELKNLMLNLTVTLRNLKKAGHCLTNKFMFLLKGVFVLYFTLIF